MDKCTLCADEFDAEQGITVLPYPCSLVCFQMDEFLGGMDSDDLFEFIAWDVEEDICAETPLLLTYEQVCKRWNLVLDFFTFEVRPIVSRPVLAR